MAWRGGGGPTRHIGPELEQGLPVARSASSHDVSEPGRTSAGAARPSSCGGRCWWGAMATTRQHPVALHVRRQLVVVPPGGSVAGPRPGSGGARPRSFGRSPGSSGRRGRAPQRGAPPTTSALTAIGRRTRPLGAAAPRSPRPHTSSATASSLLRASLPSHLADSFRLGRRTLNLDADAPGLITVVTLVAPFSHRSRLTWLEGAVARSAWVPAPDGDAPCAPSSAGRTKGVIRG